MQLKAKGLWFWSVNEFDVSLLVLTSEIYFRFSQQLLSFTMYCLSVYLSFASDLTYLCYPKIHLLDPRFGLRLLWQCVHWLKLIPLVSVVWFLMVWQRWLPWEKVFHLRRLESQTCPGMSYNWQPVDVNAVSSVEFFGRMSLRWRCIWFNSSLSMMHT